MLFSPLGDRVLAKPMKYVSLARPTLSLISCTWSNGNSCKSCTVGPFVNYYIQLKFQSQMNNGSAWRVDILIPIETPYKHFSKFLGLKGEWCSFQKIHLNYLLTGRLSLAIHTLFNSPPHMETL